NSISAAISKKRLVFRLPIIAGRSAFPSWLKSPLINLICPFHPIGNRLALYYKAYTYEQSTFGISVHAGQIDSFYTYCHICGYGMDRWLKGLFLRGRRNRTLRNKQPINVFLLQE